MVLNLFFVFLGRMQIRRWSNDKCKINMMTHAKLWSHCVSMLTIKIKKLPQPTALNFKLPAGPQGPKCFQWSWYETPACCLQSGLLTSLFLSLHIGWGQTNAVNSGGGLDNAAIDSSHFLKTSSLFSMKKYLQPCTTLLLTSKCVSAHWVAQRRTWGT